MLAHRVHGDRCGHGHDGLPLRAWHTTPQSTLTAHRFIVTIVARTVVVPATNNFGSTLCRRTVRIDAWRLMLSACGVRSLPALRHGRFAWPRRRWPSAIPGFRDRMGDLLRSHHNHPPESWCRHVRWPCRPSSSMAYAGSRRRERWAEPRTVASTKRAQERVLHSQPARKMPSMNNSRHSRHLCKTSTSDRAEISGQTPRPTAGRTHDC
jgi:hypothetical protein